MKNEIIVLANTLHTELKDLPKRIPKDAARYHFFLYKHAHEGDYLESIGKTKVFPIRNLIGLFQVLQCLLRQKDVS